MVDLETRKIVDMIESREMEDVRQWLLGYPNIQVISRDGSHTYAAAIAQAHPGALQISDRFHLVKNLTEHAKNALQKLFQGRIAIPITDETRRIWTLMLIGTVSEQVRLVKILSKEGHSKSAISLLTAASAKTVKKYLVMAEGDIPPDRQTVRGREHEEAVDKLLERAKRVRSLHEQGYSINAISQ